ncbi:MAG: RidA family protein [Tissierellia bacterium]|nr:RidA family protein [Tissierellia bacterium]
MRMKAISTEKAPAAIGPYSQGMATDHLVFTSGQLPINPETGELIGDIQGATKQSLENIQAILKAQGLDLENVVKVMIFMADMDDFAAMNEVYGSFFAEHKPARSAVAVKSLPKNAIIEIEAIAAR